MRKVFLFIVLCFIIACEGDSNVNRNPFLVDISFQMTINTNLPQYSNLNFPGNFVIVPNIGLRGVVIYAPNTSSLFAYELSDPNHAPSACSTLTVSGITASCPCGDDTNSYNILSGQPLTGNGRYGLKAYRVSRSGNIITVSN